MAVLWLLFFAWLRLTRLIECSATCDGCPLTAGPKMMAMMNRTYPLCRDADLTIKLPICEVNEDDTGDTCSLSPARFPCLKSACPDGSWNRTCYPGMRVGFLFAFTCVCRSLVSNLSAAKDTYWSEVGAMSPPVDEAFYYRSLMMGGGECITPEFWRWRPIVAGYNLPDNVYTASTDYGNGFVPYKARINGYQTGTCAWIPAISEYHPTKRRHHQRYRDRPAVHGRRICYHGIGDNLCWWRQLAGCRFQCGYDNGVWR